MSLARRRRAAAPAAVAAALLVFPAAAEAHGLGAREDLPIPSWLFAWGAAAVLIASFAALAVLWRAPKLQGRQDGRDLLTLPRGTDAVCGAIGVAILGVTMYAGLAGAQDPEANLAPAMVFIVAWVVVPVLSLLLGDVFRAFNPWRAIGLAVGWAWRRAGLADAAPEPVAYPSRLGVWPAAAFVVVFGWLELVHVNKDDPSLLALLVLAYTAVQLVGMSLVGVEAWSERGDGYGVYLRLFGRMAPLRREGRTVQLVRPLSGLPGLRETPGLVALLAAAIGVTSFDGLARGPVWTDVASTLQRGFVDLGLSQTVGYELTGTIGLLAMVGLVAGLYCLGVAGMRAVDPTRSAQSLRRSYAHTLVPIALAYVVAHYFSFVLFQGQSVVALASNPLGGGADIFGTAQVGIDYGLIGATAIWYVQVAALVGGHVAALALAHDRALGLHADVRRASRSQNYMLAVMVGFTCLGLWLLSAGAA